MANLIEIDMEELSALCRLKPTLKDCAAFFKCSEDTIERRIKEATGKTFAEFREQNMVFTRYDLVRRAIQKASSGDNTMLIFCLKNLCGWADKPAIEEIRNEDEEFSKMSDFDLEERINQLLGGKQTDL